MPVEDQNARTRTLEAAARLLGSEGPAGLSVRAIAAEAGLSTMGIYHYFGGKDGIVEALYVDGFQGLEDALAAVEVTDDPLFDIEQLSLAYATYARTRPTYYEIMFSRPVPGFQPSKESLARAMRSWRVLADTFVRAEEQGLLTISAADAALLIWSSGHGILMLQLAGNALAGDDTERIVRNGLRTMLPAISVEGAYTPSADPGAGLSGAAS
ncbi:MAG: TetR/AcrR family transcriptional regulator [Solirubrobacteraceae bacterium]|nr:TetR/AcrR family transcriptional regulator [Patulibacter sp.]